MKRSQIVLAVVCALFAVGSTWADVTLSKAFGNHTVLQQEQPIRIFGTTHAAGDRTGYRMTGFAVL